MSLCEELKQAYERHLHPFPRNGRVGMDSVHHPGIEADIFVDVVEYCAFNAGLITRVISRTALTPYAFSDDPLLHQRLQEAIDDPLCNGKAACAYLDEMAEIDEMVALARRIFAEDPDYPTK